MRWITVFVVTALGLAVISHIGIGIYAQHGASVVWAAIALGLVNVLVRPIVRLIAFPITLLTLGLFGWVINALMLWLVSDLVPGFVVTGFMPALWGSLLLGLISGGVNWLIRHT
ncbi:MAG: phage holin family protein [Firmicutes bacterium]|jgi:putative membrane protein|nr:phage holin family protein [Bacillota bacterium]MCL5971258.1 phage holin family protein [Bacillota bacterium]